MEVVSVNLGERKTVIWQGAEVETGIYKYPVDRPILLEETDVQGDQVVDRKFHGGVDKACYLYSEDHYAFWQSKYPHLDWGYGMFGENITIKGLDERDWYIGDVLKMGSALVQVSQPRQPCFKLGIKFQTQDVLRDFIQHPYSGVYLRILENGVVEKGDAVVVQERKNEGVTVAQVFELLYHPTQDEAHLKQVLHDPYLSESTRDYLKRKYVRG